MFLDHLCVHSKLEFLSLVTFSSTYEERCQFTRDYNHIKKELTNIEDYDKTCIESALKGINQIVLEEWGNNTLCQILLVTDGNTGVGPGSLRDSLNRYHQGGNFPLPFAFPAKLHVVCVCPPNEASLIRAKPQYQKLIELCGGEGSVIVPDQITEISITNLFQKLGDDMYTSFKGTLKCGHLESSIYLSPMPIPFTKVCEFEKRTYTISKTIEVVGFIAVADIGSPAGVSRHLILPTAMNSTNANTSKTDSDVEEIIEDDKQPSFCVLFHGALKVENMAALVTVADDWFGFIYSWADSKKKSNLMLTILAPGADAVPWLGDLNNLHCAEGVNQDILQSFPVRSSDKRSYSQNSVVWIRQTGLQSDIQKILRHAKKLPEKTQQFYKELNRLKKAALQLGFLELLEGLARIFELEVSQLAPNAHADIAQQLTHAAAQLHKTRIGDTKLIMPYSANYTS